MQSTALLKKETPKNTAVTADKTTTNTLQLKQPANNPLQLWAEETAAQQPKTNNTGLPDNLKAGVEALSGFSMDDVKVHYNSDKPEQFQALAYAQGTDIHIAPGQEQHLPHEAWHVVQQKQGRVQPTLQMKEGVAINDDEGLEKEADVMGRKALVTTDIDPFPATMATTNQLTMQRVLIQSPWGATKGKWRTTLDTKRVFDNKDAAQAHEEQILKNRAAEAEKAWQEEAASQAWTFKDHNKRLTTHYDDGWGLLYGIRSNTELRDFLRKVVPDNESKGIKQVDLGRHKHAGENQDRQCYILYEVIPITVKKGTIERQTVRREVYHCGPGTQLKAAKEESQ